MTENLKTALNIAVSAIATEHFFTAFLSSPKASEHFFKPEEVREMFKLASLVSICFSVVLAIILKNVWGIVACVCLILIFAYAYRRSLGLEVV